jgi:hypothetical protein
VKAFTDYPILELGDRAFVEAPVRACEILSYDGDKYCKISVGGVETTIKAGYLYEKSGRYGEVPRIRLNQLERMTNE